VSWREEARDPFGQPSGREPTPMRRLLAALVAQRRWAPRLEGAAVHGRWEEIAGARLAAHTEPVRLNGGVLVVRADSPAWATQVRYLGTELRDRANDVLGAGQVRDVHVVTGRLRGATGAAG
jgi:predicted nucleic acid-binding Zn ribbon protein